eukprot:CAMPEP_0171427320 /NCGR_PEP_ID=MMETSP0881-20121228/4534_1 /TAXON_ID=67004 /ORGANISM="Thalassiosira weissflogii, Strain CCMP1336" /LENGTH=333 /DNA_ID=CAMNT_0011946963 /DNA_START=24 /DNA_END=1022 /DNA_ORIENTATION=+
MSKDDTLSAETSASLSSEKGTNEDSWESLPIDELKIENKVLENYLKERGVTISIKEKYDESLPILFDNEHKNIASKVPVEFKLQTIIESLSKINSTISTRKDAANKLINTLKIMLNETELRIGDIQRDAHEFKKEVVDGGMCSNNKKKYKAEKLVRYFDARLCDQESVLDKLRLKNSSLLSRKRKLETQLIQKEDTSFHFIDYHQLQIQQKKNKRILESKSATLAFRKMAMEKTKQKVKALQDQLEDLKRKASANEKAIEMRRKHLARLEETLEVERRRKKVSESNQRDGTLASGEVCGGPDVMEYIQQQAEIYELRDQIRKMELKLEIGPIK